MRFYRALALGSVVIMVLARCSQLASDAPGNKTFPVQSYGSAMPEDRAKRPGQEPIAAPSYPASPTAPNAAGNSLEPINLNRFPVLFRHEFAGTLHFWNVSYNAFQPQIDGAFTVPKISLSATEHVVGMADANGDGLPDILVQDLAENASGLSNLTVWVPQDASGQVWQSVAVDPVPVGEQAVAFGDLNGTGGTEIAFHSHRKATLGQFYARILQGSTLLPTTFMNFSQPVVWRAAGNGNINGLPIQVFQHRKTGKIQVWVVAKDFSHVEVTLQESADPSRWDLIGTTLMKNYPGVVLLFRDLSNGALLAWDRDQNLALRATATVSSSVPWDFVVENAGVDYKHFNHQYPAPNIFVPDGGRYVDSIPNTFDLAGRAELAIHGLVNAFDQDDEYNLFWNTQLLGRVPYAVAGDFGSMNPKALEALALLRRMTGSRERLDVDTNLMTNFVRDVTRQGISYLPIREPAPGHFNPDYLADDTANVFLILPQVRYLSAFANYFRLMGQHPLPPSWAGDRLLQGQYSVSTRNKDYYQLWYENNQRSTQNRYTLLTAAPQGIPWNEVKRDVRDLNDGTRPLYFEQISDHSTRTIHGPADYYRTFGSPLAKDLAVKFTNWILTGQSRLFDLNGGWYTYGPDEQVCAIPYITDISQCPDGNLLSAAHSAIRTKALVGMLTAGIATQDERTVRFVENAYVALRDHPASRRFLGYFQEYVSVHKNWHARAEADEIADMIELARRLAKYRHNAQYWTDVDMYVRNQFSEMQLTPDKLAMLKNLRSQTRNANYPFVNQGAAAQENGQWVLPSTGPHSAQLRVKAGDGLFDDLLGVFGSYAMPNAWGYFTRDASGNIAGSYYDVMMCCLLNAAKALYGVWEGMYENLGNGVIQINLMMNRAAPELDVYSWLPYFGRVDVKSHLSSQLTVRMLIPPWFADEDCNQITIRVTSNVAVGRGYNCRPDRYIEFALLAGEQLRIDFPVRDFYTVQKIDSPNGPIDANFRIRGTQVVKVTPDGTERLTVNGQAKDLGVPFYTQYQNAIQPGSDRWIPPVSDGQMLIQVNRYLPIPEQSPY